MLLKFGSAGNGVRLLQRGLNKLGAILLIDGDFGPVTRDAVLDACVTLNRPVVPEADDKLQQAISSRPDPFPPLTAAGITFIARAEVSGPGEYRRKYSHPVWPSAGSGITIGIGYDLQFVDRNQIQADWRDHLPAGTVAKLTKVAGTPGTEQSLKAVRDLEVPLNDAMSVFVNRTLKHYFEQTRSVYPEIDTLPPSRRTALVSLVYNRGTRLTDDNPLRQERREMRRIRELLADGELDGVSTELDSMARLWTLPGLIQRRHDEARLWRSGFAALQLT
jgi:GH24 family phage-related lysozyme (muramidase)